MKEEELFNFIRDFGYSDLKKSTDVYSVWDCYSQEHNIYIELKCRRTHYEELLIEESKFNRLTKIATEKSMIEPNKQSRSIVLEKIFLGKFPIMVQSNFCVLSGLPREVRHSMGECLNDAAILW